MKSFFGKEKDINWLLPPEICLHLFYFNGLGRRSLWRLARGFIYWRMPTTRRSGRSLLLACHKRSVSKIFPWSFGAICWPFYHGSFQNWIRSLFFPLNEVYLSQILKASFVNSSSLKFAINVTEAFYWIKNYLLLLV